MTTSGRAGPTQLPSTALSPNTWNSGSMASDHRVRIDHVERLEMAEVGEQCTVGEHRRLGLAGGAGGVEQGGQGLRVLG